MKRQNKANSYNACLDNYNLVYIDNQIARSSQPLETIAAFPTDKS